MSGKLQRRVMQDSAKMIVNQLIAKNVISITEHHDGVRDEITYTAKLEVVV